MTMAVSRLISAVLSMVLFALVAEAQPPGAIQRVGILVSANPSVYDPLVEELRRLGYVDGHTLALEFRNAEGKPDRFPVLAAELVRSRVDVIVAAGGEAPLRAALNATTTIPIVTVAIDYDPVALGLVAGLARPGGNVTGLFLQQIELTAKRVELLKAALPKVTRLAILWEPSARDQFKAAEATSRSLGIRVQSLEVRKPPDELPEAFALAAMDRADAVLVVTTATFFRERARIAQLAISRRLPAVFAQREFAEAGGLMSYGTNMPEMFRRAAVYVHKILKGAKPADLPIEQSTKYELVLNSRTAKALGLRIPTSVLARADQVIE
jgi:putative ABC transport system substrate-binding protein